MKVMMSLGLSGFKFSDNVKALPKAGDLKHKS